MLCESNHTTRHSRPRPETTAHRRGCALTHSRHWRETTQRSLGYRTSTMLAAGRGCGWASRSTLTISRCSRTTLAADSARRLHGDTALVAPRDARCTPIPAKLVRHHSEGRKLAPESRAPEQDDAVGPARHDADGNGRVKSTMQGASPLARSTADGSTSSSRKGVRRMEWLEYQSMLQERTGLLRREHSVRGVGPAGRIVGVCSGSRGYTGQPVEPNPMSPAGSKSAPAVAQGFGPPGNGDRVAQTSNSDRPLASRKDVGRTGEGVARASPNRDNVSAGNTDASSPDGPASVAPPAMSELERLFGKPLQTGGSGCQPAGKLSRRVQEAPVSSGPAGDLQGRYSSSGNRRLHSVAGNGWDGVLEGGMNLAEGQESAQTQRTPAAQLEKVLSAKSDQAAGDHRQSDDRAGGELLGRPLASSSATHQNASAGALGGDPGDRGRGSREDEKLQQHRGGNEETPWEGAGEKAAADAPVVSRLEKLFGKPSIARPRETQQAKGRPGGEARGWKPSSATPAGRQPSVAARACGSAAEGNALRRVGGGDGVLAIGSERAGAASQLGSGDKTRAPTTTLRGPPGPPRNERAHDPGLSTQGSHFEQAGSAWKNVHARGNLNSLVAGLAGDYGVQEMLKEHDVAEVCVLVVDVARGDTAFLCVYVGGGGGSCGILYICLSLLRHDADAVGAMWFCAGDFWWCCKDAMLGCCPAVRPETCRCRLGEHLGLSMPLHFSSLPNRTIPPLLHSHRFFFVSRSQEPKKKFVAKSRCFFF